MTESEWLTCEDPREMIDHLQDTASGRKMFLFAASCWRRCSHMLADEKNRNGIAAFEALADGLQVDDASLYMPQDGSGRFLIGFNRKSPPYGLVFWRNLQYGTGAARSSVEMVAEAEASEAKTTDKEKYLRTFVPLVREIFDNPFRPVSFYSEWLTSTVVALAEGIYQEKAFDQMPILADALQDAGCENTDILTHLRDPTATHVRGCWVLDLVLGKS